jgi:alkyl sulfatase BDS1-like metallo-beta-lactamase superfamily hydrolase
MSEPWFDPQHLQQALKRRLAGVPGQLAEGFARVVRDAPEQRIEQVMRTPARRVILDGIFWQIPQHFDRERAAGAKGTVCWRITGRADGETDTYRLQIADGRCQVVRGRSELESQVTITVEGTEFLQIVTGNTDPMQAYFKGRIAITGDIMLAAQLISLFKMPFSKNGESPA